MSQGADQPPFLDYYQGKQPLVFKWFKFGFLAFLVLVIVVLLTMKRYIPSRSLNDLEFINSIAAIPVVFILICQIIAAIQSTRARKYHLALLALILIPVYIFPGILIPDSDRLIQPKTAVAASTLKYIDDSCEAFKVDMGRYPTQQEGLNILITNPDNLPDWHGPYIKSSYDPWISPIRYLIPGKKNPQSFDLISAGPDGQFGTSDDLTNW